MNSMGSNLNIITVNIFTLVCALVLRVMDINYCYYVEI